MDFLTGQLESILDQITFGGGDQGQTIQGATQFTANTQTSHLSTTMANITGSGILTHLIAAKDLTNDEFRVQLDGGPIYQVGFVDYPVPLKLKFYSSCKVSADAKSFSGNRGPQFLLGDPDGPLEDMTLYRAPSWPGAHQSRTAVDILGAGLLITSIPSDTGRIVVEVDDNSTSLVSGGSAPLHMIPFQTHLKITSDELWTRINYVLY